MKNPRNKPCACGSGKKYKKCHLLIEMEEARLANERFKQRMAERAEEAKTQLKKEWTNAATRARPGLAMLPLLLATAALGAHQPSRRG